MLEWLAEKLGLASIMPWPRASVAFLLGVIGSLITWFVSDLPWPNVILGISVALGLWTFAESIGHPVKGFCAGLIAFWIGTWTNAIQITFHKAKEVKCLYMDHGPIGDCLPLQIERDKSNG